jgi:hypothetical protein
MAKKKRKYTKSVKPKPTCGYCISYLKCKVDGVEFASNICEKFNVIKVFTCRVNGCQLDIEVCIARQNKRKCKRGCIQGEIIRSLVEKEV